MVLCAAAQSGTAADWSQVRQLQPGTEVSVETAAGARIAGKLSAVSDSAIVLSVSRRDQSIPRDSVRRISRRLPPRHRKLFTGLGIGIGSMAGLLASVPLGFKQCGANCNGEKAAMAGLVIGLPVGGALLGRQLAGKGDWEVLYSAP